MSIAWRTRGCLRLELSVEPSDQYLKSRRNLVLFSGLLMLTAIVGLDLTSKIFLLPVTVKDVAYIDEILAILVIYFAFQTSLFWSAQPAPVRTLPQYKLDFWASIGISCIAYVVYTFPIVNSIIARITEFADGYDWVSTAAGTLTAIVSSIIGFLVSLISFFAAVKVKKGSDGRNNTEHMIRHRIVGSEWKLIFNPASSKGTKQITCLENGDIGEGRNDNERKWRTQGGFLEILNSDGKVFSRFSFNESKNLFSHTNDDDTLSIRSQRIEPWEDAARR